MTYTRDALGRVSSKTERVGTEAAHTFSYAYDLTGRLTDVSKDGAPTAGPPRKSSPNMDAFYDGAQAACDWLSILPCPDLRPGPVDLSL